MSHLNQRPAALPDVHPDADPDTCALLHAAAALGLLGRRDLLPGRARVLPVTDRAAYAIVVGTRPVAEVHWSPTAVAADRERRVLAIVAAAGLAPAPVAGDGPAVWSRGTSGRVLGGPAAVSGMPDLAAVCAAWGAALARLHTLPTRGHLRCSAPAPDFRAGRALVTSRSLAYVIAEAADRREERTWTHGDQRLDTTVVGHGSGGEVAFLDWSAGGLGDPSWDLAGACVALAELAELHGVRAEVLESYLLLGYRGHQGPGRLDPGVRAAQLVADAARLVERGDPDGLRQARARLDEAHRTALRVARVGLAA